MSRKDVSTLMLLCAAALFVSLAVFFVSAGFGRILTIIPDDAAYYFGIAEHAAGGAGLTFDGINRTNGFQPLWLALLVPVFRFVHASPETMTRIVLLLQLVVLALSTIVVWRLQSRFFEKRTAALSLVAFLFFVVVPAVNGMESAILVLALSLALSYGSRVAALPGRDPKREVLLGVLLGIVMLSRLDMVFAPLVVVLALAADAVRARDTRRSHLARAALVGSGAAAVVAPYLLFNLASFGSIMPISGLLKSSFPHVSSPAYGLSSLGKRGILGVFLAAGYVSFLLARGRGRTDRPERLRAYRIPLAAMACAILLHFAHALLFMKWAVFNWHYLPYVFFGTLVVAEPVERVLAVAGPKRGSVVWRLALVAVAAAGVAAACRGFTRPLGKDWRPASYAAALWAREHTAADAVFAMKDAGNFGYFSRRRVINLDGVVNNLEYQAALRERSLNGYLAVKGVDFVVQHAFWDRPDVTAGSYDSLAVSYRSRRYECDSDSIVLRRVDEVYRSRPYFDGPYETVFIIWKFPGGSGGRDASVLEAVEMPVLVRVAARAEENGLPVAAGQ